ncbi:hypothetical protein BDW42DRAFT_190712 [Aspergillus taichungensis]|uniref:Uncharacterized protein n=1 Tax=Aspergillus taichungensis TaxID=482145 RepID=A0A2J5I7C9_9EURO|nr:hypothetical protein BDW42DRAFT_190712 [Aspergillus taichungensis]
MDGACSSHSARTLRDDHDLPVARHHETIVYEPDTAHYDDDKGFIFLTNWTPNGGRAAQIRGGCLIPDEPGGDPRGEHIITRGLAWGDQYEGCAYRLRLVHRATDTLFTVTPSRDVLTLR